MKATTALRHSLMFAVLGFAAALPARAQYAFTTFDAPVTGATETEIFEIGNNGELIGSYLDGSGVRQGFVSQNGVFTTLTAPNAASTRAFGINDAGQIVGIYRENGIQHGFLRQTNGTFTTLDFPGQDTNYAFRINNAGQVSGYYFEFPNTPDGIFITSFLRDPNGTFQPELYSTQGDGTVLRGLNNAGTQTGWWLKPDGGIEGLIHDASGFTPFDAPGPVYTLGEDINDAGDIVGFAPDLTTFEGGSFLRRANGEFISLNFPGVETTTAYGINNRGQIVGAYEDASGNLHGFVANAVPEPGTVALLSGLGVCGGLIWKRRRRK